MTREKKIYVLNTDHNTALTLQPKTNRYSLPLRKLNDLRKYDEAFDTDAVLYCSECSYNGKVQAEAFEAMKQTKRAMSFSVLYRCPVCKQKADKHFLVNTNQWTEFVSAGNSKHNARVHTFQFKYWKAYAKKEKFHLFSVPYRLSFNEETGLLYLIRLQERTIKTILWSSIFEKKDQLALESLMSSPKNVELLDAYFEQLMKARGLVYVSFSELRTEKKRDFHARYKQVLLHLRYPNLQNVPKKNWGVLSPIMRKNLTNFYGGATDFYQLMFPIASKSSAKRPDFMLSSLHYMGHFIKDRSAYHRFLHVLMKWEKQYAYKETGQMIFDYDETNWYRSFKWFHRHCKKDQIFVNRLLNLCSFTEARDEHTWRHALKHNLLDAYEMYRKLKEADSSYRTPKETNIKRLHDLLAADYNRMKKENKVIPYQDKEASLQEELKDYSFKLAEDTHELVTFGSAMDICVGSYDDKVLAKTSTIVWLTQAKKQIPDVCLEIVPKNNETFVLQQAKLADNQFPQGEVREIIIEWCQKKKIGWKSCYDLTP